MTPSRRKHETTQKENAEKALSDLQRSRKEAEVVWKVVEHAYTAVNEDNLRHVPGLSPVHEELARIRLEGMQQLAKITPDDPTVEPKVARAHAILGLISTYVGSFQRAKENLERAVELYGQLAKKYPENLEYRVQQCRALYDLAWLYWDDNRTPIARRWVEQCSESLERDYATDPRDPAVCCEIGRCLLLQGGCLPDDATRETREKLANRAIGLFEQLIGQKHREADARNGLAIATYRLVWARFDGKDQQGLLKSLDSVAALDKATLKLAPASPYLNSFAYFLHKDRAIALVKLGRAKEGLVQCEAAAAKAREIVKQSPDVGRYRVLLAEGLSKLGSDLRRVQRTADAQATFEESNQVMDGLVRRFPDRAVLAHYWVNYRNDLADFFESGPKSQGEIQARQDWLRTLDQSVQRGREFARRFPDYFWVQIAFAKSLANRARYSTEARRHAEALPYLLEAVEVYRKRVLPAASPPRPVDVTAFLNQIQMAVGCADSLGKGDEIIRLSQLALTVRPQCNDSEGLNDLGLVVNRAARAHRDAGRYAEAIQGYRQAIAIRRPAFEKAPWHWWLRVNVGGDYMHLADTYRQTRDFRNEVLANREFLKLVVGPLHGAKIEDCIDSSRPTDEAEANRIRELIKKYAKGMTRFTVPCDFNGIKYPFHVFVTNITWPKHPLEDQERWLREVRGGTLSREVMDAFHRLHKAAHENNVSFVDLCVYTLGTAPAGKGEKLTILNLGDKPSALAEAPEPPGKAAGAPFADLKARLVDLKTLLDNAPGDLGAAREAAHLYEELGQRLMKANQPRDALEALRETARLREMLARVQPTVTQHRQFLAGAFLVLGKAHAQLKELDAAYTCLHRRLDLLEQFQLDSPSTAQQSAIAETQVLLGELAELRNDRPEALRWYARAVQHKSQAARNIASILQVAPALAALLPANLRGICDRMQEVGVDMTGTTFLATFAQEVEADRKAREARAGLGAAGTRISLDKTAQVRSMTDLADSYRALAGEYLALSKSEECLNAYLKEARVREQLTRLNPLGRQLERPCPGTARRRYDQHGTGQDGRRRQAAGTAWLLGDEKATFLLADLYEQGKGVSRDVKKAALLRSNFTFGKGSRLYYQLKYAEALVEFERSEKDSPSVGRSQRIGWCLRKLGRAEQAIAAFKKSVETATEFNQTAWVVLELVETALSANKPDEVFAALALLEKRKWLSAQTAIPYTVERELAGMRAIALHMADKDASEAEKTLEEIASRPNLSSLHVRNLTLGRMADRRQAFRGPASGRQEDSCHPRRPGPGVGFALLPPQTGNHLGLSDLRWRPGRRSRRSPRKSGGEKLLPA